MVIVEEIEIVEHGTDAGGGGAEPAAVRAPVSVPGVGTRVIVDGTAVIMPGF